MLRPENVDNLDKTRGCGIPVVLHLNLAVATTDTEIKRDRRRKFKVISWWTLARTAVAATVTLKNGSNTIGTLAKGTTDNAQVNGTIDDTYEIVADNTVLYGYLSAAQEVDIYVLGMWMGAE